MSKRFKAIAIFAFEYDFKIFFKSGNAMSKSTVVSKQVKNVFSSFILCTQLVPDKLSIVPVSFYQLVVTSFFNNLSSTQDSDFVCSSDCRQSMRNCDGSSCGRSCIKSILHELLSIGIQGTTKERKSEIWRRKNVII